MRETAERRQALMLCLLSDVAGYWVALSVASLTRLHTLHNADFLLLQRDRAVCTLIFVGVAIMAGCYVHYRLTERFDSIYGVGAALIVSVLAQFILVSFLPAELPRAISRRELLFAGAIAFPLLALWRWGIARFLAGLKSFQRFYFVTGDREEGDRLAEEIRNDQAAQFSAEYVRFSALADKCKDREETGGGSGDARPDVVIVLKGRNKRQLPEMISYCETHCRRILLYPSLNEMFFFHHSILRVVGGLPLIEVPTQQTSTPYDYSKRLFDIATASTMLLLTLPITLCTAVAVKINSRGPIFYSQEWMGKSGRVFRLYKFRSMVADAEVETGPVMAKPSDARVTSVGRLIRKHRIDELPQLYNVLKGEMSLVGPRPERPHFHEEFCRQWPLFARRLMVRPGVTSLSHVMGSYSSDPADRLRYDMTYMSSMSPLTDLLILAATVRVVLGAKGAR